MDWLVRLATDMLGLTVPVLALFAFTLPLFTKVFGEKKYPGIHALIALIYGAASSTIIAAGYYYAGKPLLYAYGGWPPPIGISYEVDGLNAVIGLFTAWTLLFIGIYSLWYNHHFDEPEWYYILLIGLGIGMLGSLYTGDVFNLFVMIEVLSISAYALVAYHKRRPEAVEAAMKYAIIGATATTIYFIGLAIFYGVYGSLNMADISYRNYQLFTLLISSPTISIGSLIAVSLSLWAFTYKSALFPNHFWLPDAHPEAPTPVSAALSGLVVNIGVYASIRFLYTLYFPGSPLGVYRDIILLVLFLLGFTGAFVGALLMMVQEDVKRLLAYSTVSHIGLIYMAASLGFAGLPIGVVALALTAAVYHVLTHGTAKALLFMASGVFIDTGKTRSLSGLRGVGRLYPWVSTAFIMGFLSLMGLIPFGGFFSKLLMYKAYMEAGQVIPALLVIIVSALSVPGYAKAIYSIVFASPGRSAGYEKLKLRGVNALLFLMAIIVLLLGLLYPVIYSVLYKYVGLGLVSPEKADLYRRVFLEAYNELMP